MSQQDLIVDLKKSMKPKLGVIVSFKVHSSKKFAQEKSKRKPFRKIKPLIHNKHS